MRKLIITGFLIAVITLLGSQVSDASISTRIVQASNFIETSTFLPQVAVLPPKQNKLDFVFQDVNGISLFDNKETIIESKGKPVSITKDPFFKEMETYHYPDHTNIGFSDGHMDYVEVMESAGSFQIDGIMVPMTLIDMKEVLGEPDFEAEDGIVFQRQQSLLKLFIDKDTRKLTSIHYYHKSNI